MKNRITNLDVENFLGDFKSRSEMEILEEGSKEKNDLLESARKRGIIISKDDRDLGVIKTIYCFTSKANSNGARLPKDEFIKIFPQIIGRPMDYGHDREFILGFYIDYKFVLKDEKAIAYAIFFKGNYPKLWEKAKKFQKQKRLSSSFEIWSPKEKREKLSDGTYKLHDLGIAGGALIFEEFGEEPAFKDAKVLQLAKKANLNKCVSEECLVYASKYKGEDLIVADKNYFEDNVKENVKKLQDENKVKEQPKKVETKTEEPKKEVKVEVKKEEPKVELKPEEKKEEPKIVETGKIKCSNCSESVDYNGIDIKIKCPKCYAILNKEGIMQYPPQIKDFQVSCPSCKIDSWLILSKDNKEAKLRCESCSKEYKIDFVQSNINTKELLSKFNFVYTGSANCPQCHKQIKISGASNLENRTIKCPECKVEFGFNINHEAYKKISKIEEIKIDKIEKSAKTVKGGKVMDYKIELSKYHRYIEVDNFEDIEKFLSKDYNESKLVKSEISARLTTEKRNALPDSDFAVVVRVKNKRTGKMRKIRMFPSHDKAHIKNALARLGQSAPKATLTRLGVSIEAVKTKIMKKAKQLKMDLAEPKKATKVESKKLDIKKPEKKVEVKVEKTKDTISNALKHDVELYTLEDKIAKYTNGIRKLASKVRSTKKDLETVKAEKEDKIKFYKENAKKIHDRKVELGDFGKELSDEDIINDDKFETAQLKKQVAENKSIETASENVGDKVTGVDNYYTQARKKINANAFPKGN